MSQRFTLTQTPLAGLSVATRHPRGDSRGFLERLFCEDELADVLNGRKIRQINRTLTQMAGTVRGMHFQTPPNAEMKVVSCLRGEVFDVAVDLRRSSPTFLQCHTERLSATNHRSLVIPEGFAHGFQTLTADSELLYFHTAIHCADSEGALHPCDKRLMIEWPLSIGEMSARDRSHPMLTNDFAGVAA